MSYGNSDFSNIGRFTSGLFDGAKKTFTAAAELAQQTNGKIAATGPLGKITNRDSLKDLFATRSSYPDKEASIKSSKTMVATKGDAGLSVLSQALRQSTRPGDFTTVA